MMTPLIVPEPPNEFLESIFDNKTIEKIMGTARGYAVVATRKRQSVPDSIVSFLGIEHNFNPNITEVDSFEITEAKFYPDKDSDDFMDSIQNETMLEKVAVGMMANMTHNGQFPVCGLVYVEDKVSDDFIVFYVVFSIIDGRKRSAIYYAAKQKNGKYKIETEEIDVLNDKTRLLHRFITTCFGIASDFKLAMTSKRLSINRNN